MGDDYARLAESAETLVRFDGNRAYMRMSDGHCAALLIDVPSGQFICRTYEIRPQVCRDLGRGTPECSAELHAKSARPLLALKRQTAAKP